MDRDGEEGLLEWVGVRVHRDRGGIPLQTLSTSKGRGKGMEVPGVQGQVCILTTGGHGAQIGPGEIGEVSLLRSWNTLLELYI